MSQPVTEQTIPPLSKVRREWGRIQRQFWNRVSLLRSIWFRRWAFRVHRQQQHRLEAIPAGELTARLRQAYPAPPPDRPRTSVVIPVFNKYELTARCLLSLAALPARETFEVVVVDDGSSDATEGSLSSLPGLRFRRNAANLGFVDSCNAGAGVAAGEFLVFLNNDTLVLPGWLEGLHHAFEVRRDCGLAGSMLVYPDGTLQEAGGLVYRDGWAANRGKGQDLGSPEFNHLRPVDYCSGASIMIRAELFRAVGGFDARYRPAYYEDTDLSFAVRQAGFQVYFQPASKVIHFEGATAGKATSGGVKAFQVTNRAKFREKWADTLARQPERDGAERGGSSTGRILVVDHKVPEPDRDSGSADMFHALRIMISLGYEVDHVPLGNPVFAPRYTEAMQREGIRCFYRPYFRGLRRHLRRHPDYDIVFISRLRTMQRCFGLVRRLAPRAKIVFNTVDLNFVRVGRRAELEGSRHQARKARSHRVAELRYLDQADASILISPAERDLVASEVDPRRLAVIPLIRELPAVRATFEGSRDIAFIGHFTHRPNVDAVRFFLAEIWPSLRQALPEVRFDIIGKDFPPGLLPLLDERVTVRGLVPDLDAVLPGIRLCVAPLRFGAGLKGKLATSLGYGVPSVVSPVAIEGMGMVDGRHALVAVSPEDWVRQILELYRDRDRWERISREGVRFAEAEFSLAANRARFQRLFEGLGAAPAGR